MNTSAARLSAAIFDMDGLLIDSEPLWAQAEEEVISSLGVDISRRDELPDCLGLRIDMVVELWFAHQPWQAPDIAEVIRRISQRTMTLLEQRRPLLPGVRDALALCQAQGLKIALASASPLAMLERVLTMFGIREYFQALSSAEHLPYSKPHPEVYLNAARTLGVSPLHCVAFEDSINGMIASKAARMRSVVVPGANHRQDTRWSLADLQLNSLTELNAAHLSASY